MKKIFSFLIVLFAVMVSTLTFSSTTQMNNVQAAKVKISKKKATVYVGYTVQLRIKGTKKKVKWSSSNKKVASVDKTGEVDAKKPGKATITGKVGKKKYKCKITVKNFDDDDHEVDSKQENNIVEVTSVSLNKNDIELEIGSKEKLLATVYPQNATNKSVIWKSGNNAVATVGSDGTVVAVGAGTTYITATSGTKIANCRVVVKGFGSVSGNITYLYNNFRGNVADTNAVIILISTSGTAKSMPNLSSYVNWGLTTSINPYNSYGVYMTKADGTGKYQFNHIPTGEYKIVIISGTTTAQLAFSDNASYKLSVKNLVLPYMNETNSQFLGEFVGYKKFVIDTITIYNDKDTYYGHDFGITYC